MKKLTTLLLLPLFILSFSQTQTKESLQKPTTEGQLNQSTVYEGLDKQPVFLNNGITGFRNEFISNFNMNKVNGKKGVYKTSILFVVERDGTISQITATGLNESLNKEAIEAIKKIETKWEPGMINDTSVRCRFRLPITINID